MQCGITEAEAVKTARSVWKLEESGMNWSGQEARAIASASELEKLGGNGDATLLLMRLRAYHGHRDGGAFCLGNAMATQTLGWSVRRFKKAINALVENNLLEITHQGGCGLNDPRTARLITGAQNAHQYNNTPSPSPLCSGY